METVRPSHTRALAHLPPDAKPRPRPAGRRRSLCPAQDARCCSSSVGGRALRPRPGSLRPGARGSPTDFWTLSAAGLASVGARPARASWGWRVVLDASLACHSEGDPAGPETDRGLRDGQRVVSSHRRAGWSLGPRSLPQTGQGGRWAGGLGSLRLQGQHRGTEVKIPESPHCAVCDHRAAHLAAFLEILLKRNLLGIHLRVDAKRPPNNQNEIKLNEETASTGPSGCAGGWGGRRGCDCSKPDLCSPRLKRDPQLWAPAHLPREGPASLRPWWGAPRQEEVPWHSTRSTLGRDVASERLAALGLLHPWELKPVTPRQDKRQPPAVFA